MAQPRKRVFGPLFYSTLVLAVLVMIFTAVSSILPALAEHRELQSLIVSLGSPDPNTRDAAASALAIRGNENGPSKYLIEATRDSRSEIRALVIRKLAEMPSSAKSLMPLLSAAAADQEDEVRLAVASGLGRLALFASQSASSSMNSVNGLAPDLRKECLRILRILLNDPTVEIRVATITSLGEFRPEPVIVADLVAATRDPERDVQLAASRSLLKINGPGDADATRTLLGLITVSEAHAPRGGHRIPAVITNPVGILDLREIVGVLNGANPEVQDRAIAAIVSLLSSEDQSTRIDASEALQVFGPRARAALPALDVLLNGKDAEIRATARKAVAAIEGKASPRFVGIQIGTLTDPTVPQEWRQAALEAVREVNPSALAKATSTLIRQLTDPDPNVRMSSYELLGQILHDTQGELPESSLKSSENRSPLTAP